MYIICLADLLQKLKVLKIHFCEKNYLNCVAQWSYNFQRIKGKKFNHGDEFDEILFNYLYEVQLSVTCIQIQYYAY